MKDYDSVKRSDFRKHLDRALETAEFRKQLTEAKEESNRVIKYLDLNKKLDYKELRKPFDI